MSTPKCHGNLGIWIPHTQTICSSWLICVSQTYRVSFTKKLILIYSDVFGRQLSWRVSAEYSFTTKRYSTLPRSVIILICEAIKASIASCNESAAKPFSFWRHLNCHFFICEVQRIESEREVVRVVLLPDNASGKQRRRWSVYQCL